MIWAAMSSAGVDPLCFLKSTVNVAIYQEILEHFMIPSVDKLYGDADFIFQQDVAPAHTAQSTKSWFNGNGVTVLDWPANSPDLNPIENIWGCCKLCSSKVENSEEKTRRLRIGLSAEFLYSMTCLVICSHRKSLLSNFYRVSYRQNWRRGFYRLRQNIK